jgi:hypothetical protein
MFRPIVFPALLAGVILAAAPLSAQETRFTHDLSRGETLSLSNIDGDVRVTPARGRTAEIIARKTVRRGNGALVKAVMEESNDGIRVCTLYLDDTDDDRTSCTGRRGRNRSSRREPLDVEIAYEVRLPEGAALQVTTVDGDVHVTDLSGRASITTVDGDVIVSGRAPESISTVDGEIDVTIDEMPKAGMQYRTVDGRITVRVPSGVGLDLSGSSVDGSFSSDFPVTTSGKWGPRQFRGTVGDGGPALRLSSVDGAIRVQKR